MSTSELIGSSPKFKAVLEDVTSVAAVDCAVLIRGETGTGKEIIAGRFTTAVRGGSTDLSRSIARRFRRR